MNLQIPNEWQHIDPETGLVFPWYVKSFLDELSTWDLSDKIVFEYGMGASSAWWNAKCKLLCGVESNSEYLAEGGYLETDYKKYPYAINLFNTCFDIVIVDGMEREKCTEQALTKIKSGILIVDNWDQPSVDETVGIYAEKLLQYKHFIFHQDGHPDWKTAYFIIS